MSDPCWPPAGEHEFLIERCIAELPLDERQLLVASFFHGRAQRDLADAQGISQPALKKRLGRALRHLRLKLLHRGVICGTARGAGGSPALIPLDGMRSLVVLGFALGLVLPRTRARMVTRLTDAVLHAGGVVSAMLCLSCRDGRRCRLV